MRIVIVDDHPVVRQGVQQTLSMQEDMQVVGIAGSYSEGVDVIVSLKPDVAILDMKIPGGSGLEIIRKVRNEVPECRFVILTSYASPQNISGAVS
ncbi:MAG: response regulator transcription factor, partial [Firmicutes bacterium]|nr:response regulator transcription factor [Candidatus Fermentithermobacillaceae bacterium]